jgi:hypothetical protein
MALRTVLIDQSRPCRLRLRQLRRIYAARHFSSHHHAFRHATPSATAHALPAATAHALREFLPSSASLLKSLHLEWISVSLGHLNSGQTDGNRCAGSHV